ncbi:hypothetical protein [Streptomyces sp. NPDC000351]|uniref:hypothetical protein n=1 Tax=Streptomyces sp. NPDC000351 TaxID=3154250 RepID=UPI003331D75C
MTRIRASISTLARPRRALTATALAALVLAGCGSESPADGRSQSEPGSGVVGAEESAPPSGPEQAGFTAMLAEVAQPCSSTGETEPKTGTGSEVGSETEADTGPRPADERPTGPAGNGKESLAPGETPPDDPIEPEAPTGPAAELSDRDRCASVQHEQRVVEALQRVPEPTPAKVRKILNDLGYIDDRIHDLKQDGRTTRFYLDLREKDGRLCEKGSAAGAETDVSACVVPAAGPFTVARAGQ